MSVFAYEIALPGFDGFTDETDDRIVWISADGPAPVIAIAKELGARYCGETGRVDGESVDFRFPGDEEALREMAERMANRA